MSNRYRGLTLGIITVLIFILSLLFACGNNNDNRQAGKVLYVPFNIPETPSFVFIHLVRGQSCTECSVKTLYQWERIISMINRDDVFWGFVVDTLPEDSPDMIQAALSSRPFHYELFIDYSHEFLVNNAWLNDKDYTETNDFLLERSGKLIRVGNLLEDFSFQNEISHIERKIRKQLIQAQLDCLSAKEQYTHSVNEAKYAEEAFKQIERKYELGAVDFLAWNTAAIELAKARYSLVEAKYTYYLKLEILNIYRYF